MSEPSNPRAGGAILALACIAGASIGMAWGQASAGLVGGVAVGAIACVMLWLADRRRGR